MNEAYCCNLLKKYASSKGFYPIKHADKSTIGVPDLSLSKNGFTVWIEVKLLKYAKPPQEIRLASKLQPAAQMICLNRLQKQSKAIYFFFVNDRNTCFVMLPEKVYELTLSGEKYQPKYLPMEKLFDLAIDYPIGLVDGNDLEIINAFTQRSVGDSQNDE